LIDKLPSRNLFIKLKIGFANKHYRELTQDQQMFIAFIKKLLPELLIQASQSKKISKTHLTSLSNHSKLKKLEVMISLALA